MFRTVPRMAGYVPIDSSACLLRQPIPATERDRISSRSPGGARNQSIAIDLAGAMVCACLVDSGC